MTPRFSVLTTVFDPEPEHLAACLESVERQVGTDHVEHVIVDDCSTRREVIALLDGLGASSARTIVRRSSNGGLVAAANDALEAATGEFVVLLDHDDVLAPTALSTIAMALDADPSIDVVYSDHDLLRPDGRTASPVYKPDFSLERLRNHNYITHLVVARRSVVLDIGGFRTGTDGAQDHDLLLRLAERAGPLHHVPEILMHWRQSPASVSSSVANKPEAFDRAVTVVADHLERCGITARVEQGRHAGLVRIHREISGTPMVSVVIPSAAATGSVWGVERIFVHRAVASLLSAVDERVRLEVVVVIDEGSDPVVERGLRSIASDSIRIVHDDQPFDAARRINLGAGAARGDFVLLLAEDTELIDPGSVAEMVGLALQDDVGMVGARLLGADGTLLHGGFVLHGAISDVCRGWPGDHPGPQRLLAVERECAGVSTAAALLRRDVFNGIGGMNTVVPSESADVDLALTLRAAGYRIVWTPHAVWFDFDRGVDDPTADAERFALIERRWGPSVGTDPYSNPNLVPGRGDWLELPLRSGAPPFEVLADGRVSWG